MFCQFLFKVLFCSIFVAIVDSVILSCSKNATSVPVIPSQVEGVWYEIARIPSSEVPACVKIIVPESQLNGYYTLKLDYINNVNNGWKHTEETLVFPWSEAQNGIFNLQYGNSDVNITVKFKYLGNMANYTVVCGYSDFVPSLSIIRILYRNKLVDNTVQEEIDALASLYGINLSELTWVQQDGRCNGTKYVSGFEICILLFFYTIQTILKNAMWP